MTDYTKTTNFTAKDNLSTGNALKVIKGSYFDTEFDAISGAISTKLDSADVASTAQAQALTSDAVIITPSGLSDVLGDNGAMLADIQALTDPGFDTVLGWDESSNAVIGYTLGAGLSHAATELNVADAIAGAGLTVASSILAVGAGSGITVNANDVQLADAAASSTKAISVASGAINIDMTSLTNIEGSALAATDEIFVSVAGVSKAIAIQDVGLRVQTAQTTQTLDASDMNSIMQFTGTATLTLPLNSGVDLPVGVPVILNVKHASQVLTVTAATSVTLVSIFHPGGTSAASDTVLAGGTALLYKTATNVWAISGNIST